MIFKNSTNGYCIGIDFLHFRHFPPNKKNEIIGILSYQTIFFLHLGQYDLPETTPFSFGNRKIHTFAKLPQSAPRIITKAMSTILLLYFYV